MQLSEKNYIHYICGSPRFSQLTKFSQRKKKFRYFIASICMYKTQNRKRKSIYKSYYINHTQFLLGHATHLSMSMLSICLMVKYKKKSNLILLVYTCLLAFTLLSSNLISFDSHLAPSQFSSINLLLQIRTNFKKNFTTEITEQLVSFTEVATHFQPLNNL
jgi:hypothetical protein